MLLIGLFYPLPFILIFNYFGKLASRHQRSSVLPIFFALVIYFLSQIIAQNIWSFVAIQSAVSEKIAVNSIKENYFVINLTATFIASFITFHYYRYLELKFSETN